MARILQCLVCITVMMTSARTQRGYFYHQTYQGGVLYPVENPYQGPQGRNLEHGAISDNLSSRNQEGRKQRPESRPPQGLQRIENGTYKILNRLHLNKRGGHRTNLYTVLLMELQATLGALEETITSPNDRVVFPGPTSNMPSYSYQPLVPEECRKKGFCADIPNYPTEYVEKLVDGLGDDVKRFQMDSLDDGDVQIAQRLGGTGTDQEIELCEFTEEVYKPKTAPDKNDKWYIVLNLPNKPLQGFRIEMCKSTNSSCNPIANIQEGYKGGCKQKFAYRLMEVLDEDGSHTQKALKLPSCCSCVITTVNPFRR